MPPKSYSKLSTAWKYYLLFLWLLAAIFLSVIIYGFIAVQTQAKENPASGLAVAGAVFYIIILIVYCGFIFLNVLIRRKIQHNKKASWWFLGVSWAVIGLAVVCTVFVIIQGAVAQDYYEKNVLPKERACQEDYLNGKQSAPCLQ